MASLTKGEQQVLEILRLSPEPLTTAQIAARLDVTPQTAASAKLALIRAGVYPPSQRVREQLDRVAAIRV